LDEVKIDGGGFYGGMPQEVLDGIYIRAVGQQVGGEGMP
jgi:hypothetical protein